MSYSILKNLIKLAKNGTIRGSSHSCAIIYGKKAVSYGVNTTRTYRRAVRYRIYPSEHAEANALFKLRLKKRTSLAVMVIRILKNGRLALSKPCAHCHILLLKYNIKHIMYSTDDGAIICERIKAFSTDHKSRGFR